MVQLGVMDSEEKRRSCSKKQMKKGERKIEEDCSSVQGKEKFLEENNRDLKQLTPCLLPLTLTVKRREMSWTIDG